MLRALAHTSNALDAAIALDIDRSNADRDFFQVEKATLDFTDRDQASRVDASLDAALEDAIIKASDALYSLEKRMLDRFTRDKVYVRAFFFNVSAKRKKRAVEEPPASQEPPATTEPPVTRPPIEAS